MAENVLNDFASDADIKNFEAKFVTEKSLGRVSPTTHFEYSWCLIRSRYKDDVKEGIRLLEELCRGGQDQRDFLFFLGIGYCKLGEYESALRFINRLLAIEPNNYQAMGLRDYTEKQMKKDGLLGMAIVSGVALLGVAAGLVMLKKK